MFKKIKFLILTNFFFLILLNVISKEAFSDEFPIIESEEHLEGDTQLELEKGFSESTGLVDKDKNLVEHDRLKWGGSFWSEFKYSEFGSAIGSKGFLGQPNSLWLYLDSRLKNDVRVFVKGKMVYDPTTASSIYSGSKISKITTDLEEIKLFWTAQRKVFFTVGKQKIKWGSNRFWNPTDFLNNERRNFLYSEDLRSGIPLLKTHVPVGASNVYFVQGVEEAGSLNRMNFAVRAEIPLLESEWAFTTSYKTGARPWLGIDTSFGIWNLDFTAEFAYNAEVDISRFNEIGAIADSSESSKTFAVGVSYEQPYSDVDSVTFGMEYFYQNTGYQNTQSYPFVLASGRYIPFFLAKQYGLISGYLPNPFQLDDVSFTLLQLVNLSDHSYLTRLETSITSLDDLTFTVGGGVHFGNTAGEFKYGDQRFDFGVRLSTVF